MQRFLLDAAAPGGGILDMAFPIIMMVAVVYFLMIRPQKKREKEASEMRASIEVGDEVVTGGGIIGRVVTVRDDSLVLESGSSNTKLRIARWAVHANNSAQERVQESARARALEKEKAKEAKQSAKQKDKDE